MADINDVMNLEMGTLCPFYWKMTALHFLEDFLHPVQVFFIMFAKATPEALSSNYRADGIVNMIDEFKLTKPTVSWITAFLQTILFIGYMIGTILFGQLADKFGRRSVGWKVFVLILLCNMSMGLCPNWQSLGVVRFIAGLGIGGVSVTNTVLIQELCGEKIWAANGNLNNFVGSIANLVFLMIAYFVPYWRYLSFATSALSITGAFFYIYVPESPRWLYTQRRYSEAEDAIARIQRANGKKISEPLRLLPIDDPEESVVVNKGKKYSVLDLLRYPILRYRSIISSYVWFVTSFTFYAISLAVGAFNPNFYVAYALSTISQLPSTPLTYFLMQNKRIGRRGTLVIYMTTLCISMCTMYIIPNTHHYEEARVIILIITKVSTSGMFILIYIYTPELFPTVVRNVGLGTMSTVARIGSILAPFLADITVHEKYAFPFILYGLLTEVAALMVLYLPETLGKKITNTVQEAYEQEQDDEEEEDSQITLLSSS